jgi:hypothetical protein
LSSNFLGNEHLYINGDPDQHFPINACKPSSSSPTWSSKTRSSARYRYLLHESLASESSRLVITVWERRQRMWGYVRHLLIPLYRTWVVQRKKENNNNNVLCASLCLTPPWLLQYLTLPAHIPRRGEGHANTRATRVEVEPLWLLQSSDCWNPSQEVSCMTRTSQEHAPLVIGHLGAEASARITRRVHG